MEKSNKTGVLVHGLLCFFQIISYYPLSLNQIGIDLICLLHTHYLKKKHPSWDFLLTLTFASLW